MENVKKLEALKERLLKFDLSNVTKDIKEKARESGYIGGELFNSIELNDEEIKREIQSLRTKSVGEALDAPPKIAGKNEPVQEANELEETRNRVLNKMKSSQRKEWLWVFGVLALLIAFWIYEKYAV